MTALLFAAGCGSSGPVDSPDDERDATRTDLKAMTVSGGQGGDFSVQLGGATPGALAEAARSGPVWLDLRRPGGLSFGGLALLEGKSVFKPRRGEIVYARARTGGRARRDPVLLRLEGTVSGDAVDPRIEVIEDPKRPVEGLGSIESDGLRILLGKGVDNMMRMKGNAKGGYSYYDTHGWVAVVDAEDNVVPWRERLAGAQRAADLEQLAPYRVIVRRWRAGSARPALFVKLALTDVVLAGQMKLKGTSGRFNWVWEGVWRGTLGSAPEPVVPPAWPAAPDFLVRYREYTPVRSRGSSSVFKTLLSPIALGADIGAALFEETFAEDSADTSTADRVRDKQSQR